jgi:hypothetical protein
VRPPYWAFTAAVTVATLALTFALYVRRARAWLIETYDLVRAARLNEAQARLERELAGQPRYARAVLDLLAAEIAFWRGELEPALLLAKAPDLKALPPLWHSGVHSLVVVANVFTGRVEQARHVLYENEQSLRERPGFHELEALVEMRAGNPLKARERLASTTEKEPRPKLARAAVALLEAEIAIALGEPADEHIAEAVELGGDSFVPQAAKSLRSR